VLPTFVIGLREGLEASLIVGIIAAFLIQRGERRALRPMWFGVAAAVALCFGVAFVLRAIGESLSSRQREGFEAILALLAVAGITYMIVWMRRHSRELKGSLEHSAAMALAAGSTFALIGMAFFAVLREGLETAVFLLATFENSKNPVATGAGAVIGIALAIGLGLGIYLGGVRINLSRFFRVTGFVLVLVAAGLVALAIHAASEAGWVPALQSPAFDLAWLVAPGSIRASLLTGVLGLQPVPTVAEVLGWLLYAVPMSLYVLWPHRPRPVRTAPVPVTAP
jgi:high-affinity iron transporter